MDVDVSMYLRSLSLMQNKYIRRELMAECPEPDILTITEITRLMKIRLKKSISRSRRLYATILTESECDSCGATKNVEYIRIDERGLMGSVMFIRYHHFPKQWRLRKLREDYVPMCAKCSHYIVGRDKNKIKGPDGRFVRRA